MPGQRERSELLDEDGASETNSRKAHTVPIDSDSDDSDDRFLKSVFPISNKAENILAVPSIDSIVGNLLLKKYGQKAVKSQSLCSQPMKDLEKIAYQGQHAARMGTVINVYMQQALRNLLSKLTDKQCNIDSAIVCGTFCHKY
ncbi:hypothetical protein MAR_023114 [Mya arenaria]|uniref:Uncharacterized protein n=1 Tax=Mya arenaria TaxID=6604 RepID=A0ABY7DP92_MYAAR|nr:hypothetical protein MAR_023114 [Mya arenaria]